MLQGIVNPGKVVTEDNGSSKHLSALHLGVPECCRGKQNRTILRVGGSKYAIFE